MNLNGPRLSIDTGLDVDLPPDDMSELDEITVQFHMASSRRAQRARPTDTDSGIGKSFERFVFRILIWWSWFTKPQPLFNLKIVYSYVT